MQDTAQAPVTEAGEAGLDALAVKGGDGKAEAHGLGGPSTVDSTVATSRPPQDEHSAEQAASREDSTGPGASTGAHDVDPRDPEPWAGQAAAASPKAEGEPATIWDCEAAAELAAALQRVHATQRVQERVLGDTFAALQMAVAELRARDAQRASELAALRDATAGLVRRLGELAGDVHELRERDIERAFADDTAAKAAAAARAAEMERIDAHVGPRLPPLPFPLRVPLPYQHASGSSPPPRAPHEKVPPPPPSRQAPASPAARPSGPRVRAALTRRGNL